MRASIRAEQRAIDESSPGNIGRREFILAGTSVAVATVFGGGVTSAVADQVGRPTVVTPIYAIRQNGDMLYYLHAGVNDGAPTWSVQAKTVGNGWDFRHVFAGVGGAIY